MAKDEIKVRFYPVSKGQDDVYLCADCGRRVSLPKLGVPVVCSCGSMLVRYPAVVKW